jgi:hypothetical protein
LKTANKRQDVAKVRLGTVVLPPGLIRVDGALRGDLIVNALQEPGQLCEVVRVNAAEDLELRVQVPQLPHVEAGCHEVCHIVGANRCVTKQQLSHVLPERQRYRET